MDGLLCTNEQMAEIAKMTKMSKKANLTEEWSNCPKTAKNIELRKRPKSNFDKIGQNGENGKNAKIGSIGQND